MLSILLRGLVFGLGAEFGVHVFKQITKRGKQNETTTGSEQLQGNDTANTVRSEGSTKPKLRPANKQPRTRAVKTRPAHPGKSDTPRPTDALSLVQDTQGRATGGSTTN